MPLTRATTAPPATPTGREPAASAQALARELRAPGTPARRAQLLNGLVALATPQAATTLAALLDHDDPAVRACATEGLRRIGPVLARPALHALLEHASADLRLRGLDAIERVPDAEVEGWIVALLGREHHANVCATALDLLAEIGSSAALPAIRAARLRFADEPFIAFAADHAIAQIVEG